MQPRPSRCAAAPRTLPVPTVSRLAHRRVHTQRDHAALKLENDALKRKAEDQKRRIADLGTPCDP